MFKLIRDLLGLYDHKYEPITWARVSVNEQAGLAIYQQTFQCTKCAARKIHRMTYEV